MIDSSITKIEPVQSVIMQKLPSKDTSMKKTENSRIEQDQKNLRQQPF